MGTSYDGGDGGLQSVMTLVIEAEEDVATQCKILPQEKKLLLSPWCICRPIKISHAVIVIQKKILTSKSQCAGTDSGLAAWSLLSDTFLPNYTAHCCMPTPERNPLVFYEYRSRLLRWTLAPLHNISLNFFNMLYYYM